MRKFHAMALCGFVLVAGVLWWALARRMPEPHLSPRATAEAERESPSRLAPRELPSLPTPAAPAPRSPRTSPSGADRLRITPADANLDPTDFVLVKVRDTENRPLAHVDVTLTDWKKEVFVAEGATDSSGSVLLEYESPGVAIWANANLGGWGMARAFVERSEGELELVLPPASTLWVRSVDQHGDPFPGAELVADTSHLGRVPFITDAEGRAEVRYPETAGQPTIRAGDVAMRIRISPRREPTFDDPVVVECTRSCVVEGIVLSAAGVPMRNAAVRSIRHQPELDASLETEPYRDDDGRTVFLGRALSQRRETWTDKHGRFRLGPFEPSDVPILVSASAEEAQGTIGPLTLNDPSLPVEVTIRLGAPPYASLTVRVLEPDGSPVEDDVVQVHLGVKTPFRAARWPDTSFLYGDSGASYETRDKEWVHDEGTVLFGKLPAGDYLASAHYRGAPTVSKTITLGERQQATLEVILPEGASLRGVAVDTDGNPIRSLPIGFFTPDSREPLAVTSSGLKGRFRFDRLPSVTGRLSYDPRGLGPYLTSSLEGVTPGGKSVELVVGLAPKVRGRITGAPHRLPLTFEARESGTQHFRRLGAHLGEVNSFTCYVPWDNKPFDLQIREGEDRQLLLSSLVVSAGDVLDLGNLVMPDPDYVTGIVTDASTGRPIEGASVAMTRNQHPFRENGTTTAADGTFRMRYSENMPLIIAHAPGYADVREPIDRPAHVSLRLEKLSLVRGRIVEDPDVDGPTRIRFLDSSDPSRRRELAANFDGAFDLVIAPGTWHVEVLYRRAGRQETKALPTITIAPSESLDLGEIEIP